MIKKHGSHYWLDIRVNGQRVRRSLKTGEYTRAIGEAQRLTRELQEAAVAGKVGFPDFCAKYLDWAWTHKPRSADREEQRLKKIQAYFGGLGIKRLADISPYHLEQFRTHLKNQGLEKTTINRYLQILRGMFYKAIDWELYQGPNPAKKIKFYREESRVQAPPAEDIEKILAAARAVAAKARSPLQRALPDLIALAVNTGLRKSEILNLRWHDIKKGSLEVEGKGGRRRLVPLNAAALEILARQPRRTEFVFHIPNRAQHDLFRRTIWQIRRATGLDFHFHLLRHYFASALVARGVDLITVSEILGHSRLTTSLIYSHTSEDRKRAAVEILGT